MTPNGKPNTEDTTNRRFRLMHPALAAMQETNSQLVCRNLEYIDRLCDLQKRVSLLEEQRRVAQYRLGDCLYLLRDLRLEIEQAGEENIGKKLDLQIKAFLER